MEHQSYRIVGHSKEKNGEKLLCQRKELASFNLASVERELHSVGLLRGTRCSIQMSKTDNCQFYPARIAFVPENGMNGYMASSDFCTPSS